MTVPTAGGFFRSLLLKPVPIRNLRPLSSVTSNEPTILIHFPACIPLPAMDQYFDLYHWYLLQQEEKHQ